MLRELRIRNFALIDGLDLSFSHGFTVFTGETGAGKSIIIDAIDLLVGGRGSVSQIRSGCDEAILEALCDLPTDPEVVSRLATTGWSPQGETHLIIQRILSRTGKNRVSLNGYPVPLATLRMVGNGLIDIHGQHEHQSLFHPETQRNLLDTYGGIVDQREAYRACFRQWRALTDELSELERKVQQTSRQEEFLRYEEKEIRDANLRVGEEEELVREKEVLSHAHQITSLARHAYSVLSSSEGSVLSQMAQIGNSLAKLSQIDSRMAEILSVWNSAVIGAKEVAEAVRDRMETLSDDPQQLESIEERLYQISRLKKKYGGSISEVLSYLLQMQEQLSCLGREEERIRTLTTEKKEIEARLGEQAERLSQLRLAAADALKKAMERELSLLGMRQTQFVVSVTSEEEDSDQRISATGKDRVEFLISPDPGEEVKPLARVASGGELSRMMLALKSILTSADQVPTLIFDEIDAGIGGAVAELVGKRLKQIAKAHQVFCVTHLPQIAALADIHYFVEKNREGERVVTTARKLGSPARVKEIARMLGGEEITRLTLKHAEEMLKRGNAQARPLDAPS